MLSALGVGAGFLYALGIRGRGTNANGSSESAENFSGVAANELGEETKPKSSMARIDDGAAHTPVKTELDDLGTDQSQASQILKNIRDSAFDSSDEKLALALGRPTEEIEEWTHGAQNIDGDVVMKARALAIQRGVEVE
jgi:hypothetical protein